MENNFYEQNLFTLKYFEDNLRKKKENSKLSDNNENYNNLYKHYEKLLLKDNQILSQYKKVISEKANLIKEIHSNGVIISKLKSLLSDEEKEKNKYIEYNSRLENKLLKICKEKDIGNTSLKETYEMTLNSKHIEISTLNKKIKESMAIIEKISKENEDLSINVKAYRSTLEKIKLYEKSDSKLNNIENLLKNEKIQFELEEKNLKLDEITNIYNKLLLDYEESQSKIVELSFAKSSLAEMLIETETKLAKLNKDFVEFQQKCSDSEKEKDVLSDYIETLDKNNKQTFEKINYDNIALQATIKEGENTISYLNDIVAENNTNIKLLEDEIRVLKCENFEKTHVNNEKEELIYKLKEQLSDCNIRIKILQDEKSNFERELIRVNKRLNELSEQNEKLEMENFNLLSTNKELIIEKDSSLKELMYENTRSNLDNKTLNSQIESLNKEILKLKFDKNSMKDMFQESLTKISLNQKNENRLYQENIKLTKMILHLKSKNEKFQKILNSTGLKIKEDNNNYKFNESNFENSVSGDNIFISNNLDIDSNETNYNQLQDQYQYISNDKYKEEFFYSKFDKDNLLESNILNKITDNKELENVNNNSHIECFDNSKIKECSLLNILRKEKENNKNLLSEMRKINHNIGLK